MRALGVGALHVRQHRHRPWPVDRGDGADRGGRSARYPAHRGAARAGGGLDGPWLLQRHPKAADGAGAYAAGNGQCARRRHQRGVVPTCRCFLVAGRTPITEGELRGGKSQNIHWRQESRDQGNIVREFVKWDYEMRTNQNLAAVVSRAYKIAMSEPRGPVYLTLPREWLAEADGIDAGVCAGVSGAGDEDAGRSSVVGENRGLLIAADSPLIVTKYLGRNPEAVQSVGGVGELLGDPRRAADDLRQFPHGSSAATWATRW